MSKTEINFLVIRVADLLCVMRNHIRGNTRTLRTYLENWFGANTKCDSRCPDADNKTRHCGILFNYGHFLCHMCTQHRMIFWWKFSVGNSSHDVVLTSRSFPQRLRWNGPNIWSKVAIWVEYWGSTTEWVQQYTIAMMTYHNLETSN